MLAESFNLSIGDLITRFSFSEAIPAKCLDKFQGFSCKNQASFCVQVNIGAESDRRHKLGHNFEPEIQFTPNEVNITFPIGYGVINIHHKTGILFTSLDLFRYTFDYYLRILYSIQIFYSGGLLIHSAGINHKQKGYAFIGHSESGKTTITINSSDDLVLNDDLNVVKINRGEQIGIFSTPFSSSRLTFVDTNVKLEKIFFLQKNHQNYLTNVGFGEAMAEFISNIPILTTNVEFFDELYKRASMILKKVQYYRLHFLPDKSFWKTIDF